MMTCPDCDAREAFSTVKCACGYMFPLEVRKREEHRVGDERKKLVGTLVRYPMLRITAQIYRVLAGLAGVVGFIRLIHNLQTLFPDEGSKVRPSASGLLVELLLTALTVVTTLAVSEGIAVLAEINDRRAPRVEA